MKNSREVFDEEDNAKAEDPEHEGDQLGDDGPGVLTDLQPAAQLEQVSDEHSREAVEATAHRAQSSTERKNNFNRNILGILRITIMSEK